MKFKLGFPRSHRLINKADFKQVFDDAIKVGQTYMTVLCRLNKRPYARLGIIVGKRIVNKAVDRNRIRRIIRDSFRLSQDKLTGWDIVIIIKQRCHTLSKEEIRKGIDHLWVKLSKQPQYHSSH